MKALRTIFGPALLAIAVVAGLAYLFSGDDEEYLEDAPAPKLAAPEPFDPPEPVPYQAPPPSPPPAEPAPAPEPEPEGPADGGAFAPNPFITDASNPPPLEPKLREHAVVMIAPALKMALDRGDLKQLRQLRDFAEQRKRENILPENDFQALEHAIACLEQAPDARQEAVDFLRFGRGTQFAEGLTKACEQ